MLTLITCGLVAMIVVGAISLVAYNFIPPYHQPWGGDIVEIINCGGSGLLGVVLGPFMINRGFRTFLTRINLVEDELDQQGAMPGCNAVLNGLGQLFFGLFFLVVGLGMLTVVFFQEALPKLGL